MIVSLIVVAILNINLPMGPDYGLPNNLVDHKPITILKDEDFEKYNFLGNGTESNPYIIENYNITTEEDIAIYISFTTKYFIIRNCYLNAK